MQQRLIQVFIQRGVRSTTENVEIYYTDGSNQSFENFQDFETLVVSIDKNTNTLNLQFNIVYPNTDNTKLTPHMCKIDIRFRSRLGIKYPENIPNLLKAMISKDLPIIEVNIQHDNFIVAQEILSTVENWTKTLATSTSNSTFNQVICYIADFLSALSKFIVLIIIAFALVKSLPPEFESLESLAYFIIIALSTTIYIPPLMQRIMTIFKEKIIYNTDISYIKLSQTDEVTINQAMKKQSSTFKNFSTQLAIGILGSTASWYLIEFVLK